VNSTIMIRRMRADADAASLESQPSAPLGADATRILASVENITGVEIQSQQGDRVILRFESSASRMDYGPIDAALQANGMHRLV